MSGNSETKPLTHAQMAYQISRMLRTVSGASVSLAEGMWNPVFCSAECSGYALSICDDLKRQIRHLEKCAKQSSLFSCQLRKDDRL